MMGMVSSSSFSRSGKAHILSDLELVPNAMNSPLLGLKQAHLMGYASVNMAF